MADDIASTVRDFLLAEFQPEDPEALGEHTQLIEEEILDSIGIFSLVSFLEERYGIEIPADDVVIEHFETIGDIVALVQRTKGG